MHRGALPTGVLGSDELDSMFYLIIRIMRFFHIQNGYAVRLDGVPVFFIFYQELVSSPLRTFPFRFIRYAMTERRVTIPINISRSSTTGTKF